jgi:hypothetical protein
MSPVPVARHDVSATRPPAGSSATAASAAATTARSGAPKSDSSRRALASNATDDEILEIRLPYLAKTAGSNPDMQEADSSPLANNQRTFDFDASPGDASSAADPSQPADGEHANEPEDLRTVFDANPQLRQAWQDAHAYREAFATPEDARAATAQLADLGRMDALFFSRHPEHHAELARSLASLDPAAFASFTQAAAELAAQTQGQHSRAAIPATGTRERNGDVPSAQTRTEGHNHRDATASTRHAPAGPSAAQTEFFQTANAEAVQGVLGAIESQVERLLPDGISKSARNRVVGEIYRELDSALQSNRQFGQQIREAFRSGSLDADHQRAIVSLITGRARQTLPGVAKRVLSEWTSTVVAANHDRRARQHAAEERVDIAGSGRAGSEGRRSMVPRDIDYARMSDSEILNL